MAETNYDNLIIGDKNDEGRSVLISQSADRPNAFNSYRQGKMSAADVKAMFDRPFLYVRSKFNDLLKRLKSRDEAVEEKFVKQGEEISDFKTATETKITAQDNKITAQDNKITEQDNKITEQDNKITEQNEKVNEVYEAYKSGELKGEKGDAYVITDADKQEIAQMVLSEYVDGNEVEYTGEGVSADG